MARKRTHWTFPVYYFIETLEEVPGGFKGAIVMTQSRPDERTTYALRRTRDIREADIMSLLWWEGEERGIHGP